MSAFSKKPFFVSLCVHLFVFIFISFSFKPRVISATVFSISYLGESAIILDARTGVPQFPAPAFTQNRMFSYFNQNRARLFFRASFDDARNKRFARLLGQHIKPGLPILGSKDKLSFVDKKEPAYFLLQHKTPVFIFHPILPAGFGLYFKDRQLAHVELSYRMPSDAGFRLLPVVKRKISSGNLEVDLLCKRYITNYLFAQRLVFAPSTWQVVKIDLSNKDDER